MNCVVVGGGAAGFFAAITCAQAAPEARVVLLESGRQLLTKVRISGGGRCNVTHSCFEPRALAERYPRGGRALIAPFHRFQPRDTVEWFAARGVRLKTEADGRMFPATNSSQTIVDCLLEAARDAGVELRTGCGVRAAQALPGGGFTLSLTDGTSMDSSRLCVATGGCRTPAAGRWLEALGHTLEPPVPSLFTFPIDTPWLRDLPGIAVESVEVAVPGTKLRERGPVLVTHWGLSGPAILRLSAWGARELHARDYRFGLAVNWLPGRNRDSLLGEFQARRAAQPGKSVANTPLDGLPSRLWETLVRVADADARWTTLSRDAARRLAGLLVHTTLPVSGKSLNKDEFVTCGGVRLREVDFQTMESRVAPGLYFAGEVLDIDGITGGFNFQAAWTTAWIAGSAMALPSTKAAS